MPSTNMQQLPTVTLPAFDVALVDTAQKHLDRARLSVIATDGDYEQEATELKGCTARERMYESALKQLTAPILEALAKIRAIWSRPLELVREERELRKRRMAAYVEAKQIEQRRLQRIADEQADKERKRLEAKAFKENERGNAEKAAAIAQQAAMTVAQIVRTDPPKIAGQSVREVWSFHIEDEALIPRQYLEPDMSKIRRYVGAMKADAQIPGVRIWSEKRIASGV